MYTTTRKITGSTVMTCKDCGHAISMNEICEKPIQAATDMLKHMAAHKRSRAFAVREPVLEAELIPAVESASPLAATDFQPFESPIGQLTPSQPESLDEFLRRPALCPSQSSVTGLGDGLDVSWP